MVSYYIVKFSKLSSEQQINSEKNKCFPQSNRKKKNATDWAMQKCYFNELMFYEELCEAFNLRKYCIPQTKY